MALTIPFSYSTKITDLNLAINSTNLEFFVNEYDDGPDQDNLDNAYK